MRNNTEKIEVLLLSAVKKHPTDLVSHVATRLGLSRTAVQGHVRKLVQSGKLLKRGSTRAVVYSLPKSGERRWNYVLKPGLGEDVIWSETAAPLLAAEHRNILDICRYGFTEMVNNVIDHSQSADLLVVLDLSPAEVNLSVHDNGVGIFNKIKIAKGLASPREAVLELTKGKVTTDPVRHTGQGVFFTSRMFDRFSILSDSLFYKKDNQQDDWYLDDAKDPIQGTSVRMQISRKATREARVVFDQYTDPETMAFSKTHILVTLAKLPDTDFISRSEAKRILVGLDRFQEIMLDFARVRTIGQGFADEAFRVFQNQYPGIVIGHMNANENVEFMIRSVLATSSRPT